MKKFAFVILHYNSLEDTRECISSIVEKCEGYDYRVYIVDNNSPNGSGSLLVGEYGSEKRIYVLLSKKNLGFAKGNNIGICQAISDGYGDFIIALNNDTKVLQSDFCAVIENEFEKSEFAVLGPTIYTPAGRTSINPGRQNVLRGTALNKMEKAYSQKLFLLKLHMQWLSFLYKKIHLFVKREKEKPNAFQYVENCLLHGCCLIFSKKYLDIMHGFDPCTFLYFEEDILFAHCIGLGLKTVYNPNLCIYHKEDGATDSVYSKPRKKMIFVYSHILDSIKRYRNVLKMYGME